MFKLLLLIGFLFVVQPSLSQELPFLTDDEIRMLSNELSGDRAYEHIRVLTRWHRDSGMKGFFEAADYVMQAAKEAGLEDVKFIEQPLEGKNYTAKTAELWMIEPVEVKLADIGDHAVMLADGSHDADVTAELVWIESNSKDVLKKVDVKGKIVLTPGSPGGAANNAVYDKGAVGVVSYMTTEGRNPLDVPDQIAWGRIALDPPQGKQGTFAFMVSPRVGETLKKMLQSAGEQDYFATGKKVPGGRIVVRARVDTEIGEKNPGRTGFVEGWIKGTKYHDQQIILTAHLQEEKGSANDDGSGCANLLEIARTFNKLVKDGKIQRPLRDIRFWWTDEIYSEYRYFKDHPEEPKKFLANVHMDMVGARQTMGNRVQHIIMAPHSRTSYLDAIFEGFGNFLILTNNGFLAASRAGGYPRPYTRPMYSTLGSREGYNARFVPYFNSSDHMCFIEGIIGVPAVATINWDDPYIHSSSDDLWQVDQTQLKRNAFLVGGTAFTLAYMEEPKLPVLAAETYTQGLRRIGSDMQVAMRAIEDSASGKDKAWKDAKLVLEQGIQREVRALNSIRVFSSSSKLFDPLVERMSKKAMLLTGDLETYYTQLYGAAPAETVDSLETDAMKMVPKNISSVKEYFENREKVRPGTKLHSLMRDEVYNFVDGKRSYYDIYKAVRAEQLAGGSWYYGTVTLDDVVGLLDAAVAGGVLELKK